MNAPPTFSNQGEVEALSKFNCPSCGAAAEWSAATQTLACPYCGTVSPLAPPAAGAGTGGAIREHDLVTALQAIPDDRRGWQGERASVRCKSCNAISVFPPERVAQNCEFCGSPALIPVNEIRAPIRPESVLPFTIAESTVRETLRKWYGSHWFAPNRLKTAALTDTVHGLYIPYWTFDARVDADWTAEAGHSYYETETYRDSDGRRRSRQVRRIRWVPASGSIAHAFDDELVPASRGVNPDLLRRVEPFPTGNLVPYNPAYVSGWVVEQYQIDLVAAARHAREVMHEKALGLCAREVPGDTHRNLQARVRFTGQTFKHILVPVWLVAYTYGARGYQIVVNASTGAIAGAHPVSWVKVALAVIGVLGLLLLGAAVFGR